MSSQPDHSEAYEGIAHEHNLYPDVVAQVGGFPITNSLLNSWIVVFILVILSLIIKSRIKEIPGRFQSGVEIVIEKFLGLFDSLTGSREKSIYFFPLVFAFFIFILLNNWIGLLPIVGSVGQIVVEEGQKFFIPYFRGATADLNTTLALALVGVIASHIMGIVVIGTWKYVNKFVNLEAIIEIPKKIVSEPSILIVNPIKIFIGLIEIIGEIAKVASLSFRLFGNIFAGELLLAVMIGLFAWGIPLPFMFLEVLVGLVQALIFSLLVLSYLVTMTTAEH